MALNDQKLDTMPEGTPVGVLGVDANGQPVLTTPGSIVVNGDTGIRNNIAVATSVPVRDGLTQLIVGGAIFSYSATDPGGVDGVTKFQTADGKWWKLTPDVTVSRIVDPGALALAIELDFEPILAAAVEQATSDAEASMVSASQSEAGAEISANRAEAEADEAEISALDATNAALSAVAVSFKTPVRLATTSSGTLASSFENGDTVDGVVLATGDRILIKNQAAPAENGIYTVSASGAPTRATDANTDVKLLRAGVLVSAGVVNAGTQFVNTSMLPITIDVTALSFVKIDQPSDQSLVSDALDYFGGETGAALTDDAGNAVLIATDMRFKVPTFEATETEITHPAFQALEGQAPEVLETWEETGAALTDDAGNAVLVASDKRFEVPTFLATATEIEHPAVQALQARVPVAVNAWPDLTAITRILQIIYWGQSLSVGGTGGSADPEGGPDVISTTPLTYASMFNGGTRWTDGSANDPGVGKNSPAYIAAQHASLVDLYEGVTMDVETSSNGSAQIIAQLYEADTGVSLTAAGLKLLLSNPGEGSTTAIEDGVTGAQWPRLVADFAYGKSLADAAGKSSSVGAMPISQGQSDTSANPTTWKAQWRQNKADALAAYFTATGIERDFITPINQMGRPSGSVNTVLAQLDLAQEDGWCLGTTEYFMPYRADFTHLTAIGYKWNGAYTGRAIYNWLFRGRRPRPLLPYKIERMGKNVILVFQTDHDRKLIFDNKYVPDLTNKGFELFDAARSPIAITGVTIFDFNKVELKTASSVPSGFTVDYGVTGDGTRTLGNVRDDDPLIFDPQGISKPMHSWVPIFSMGAI